MKILFFARRFHPLVGGVEKHVLEISLRLIEKGHQVTVITEQVDDLPPVEILKPAGIKIYRLPVGPETAAKKFQVWKELWKIKHLVKQADVVHCHDIFFWYFPFRFYYLTKPVYTTFHGYESFPITKKAVIMRKISEALSRGNICIGDFIKKWYSTNPTFVSYGAVDRKKFKNGGKTFKNESAVFIGRLDEQTGILTYAKAFEKIKKQSPKFSMIAVGDGKYRSKIDKKIKVLGFKKNAESYLESNHFAFVSRYLAILEAFAAKKLVFAVYDNPVKEDYLRMAPFADYIIIACTAEELYNQIIHMLRHPETERKLVDKAYKWSKKQTWENMVELYIKLWKK